MDARFKMIAIRHCEVIILRPDRVIADRKISLNELAGKVGIDIVSLIVNGGREIARRNL